MFAAKAKHIAESADVSYVTFGGWSMPRLPSASVSAVAFEALWNRPIAQQCLRRRSCASSMLRMAIRGRAIPVSQGPPATGPLAMAAGGR
jgi:hypothetical protein